MCSANCDSAPRPNRDAIPAPDSGLFRLLADQRAEEIESQKRDNQQRGCRPGDCQRASVPQSGSRMLSAQGQTETTIQPV